MTSAINCGGEPYILLSTMNEIMGLLWQRVDSVTEPIDLSTGYATALGDTIEYVPIAQLDRALRYGRSYGYAIIGP